MSGVWRKLENESGFPYYINESKDIEQWDHPKFIDIKQQLDDCNYIRYSTYRVAAKLRVLHQTLYMEEVPLVVIKGVFERHRLGNTESSLCLESYDIEAVLSDIYFAANKQNHTNTDIDFATELMMNLLYNVFDKDRRGITNVSSTKLLLALLSNCRLADLYQFIYQLCADHNSCVTRLKLHWVLTKIADITAYMHEDINFGHHLINSSVESCFSNSPGLVGVSENTFITWLESSPQVVAWIPTMFRMKTAETVVHAAKCSVCKAVPLLGLRYKCLKCSSYVQCQHCFLSTKVSHSHKLNHSMKEYCTEGTSKDFTHLFFKKLCGFLRWPFKLDSMAFSCDADTKVLSKDKDGVHYAAPKDETTVLEIKPLSSPQAQLQTIIRQLELQNRELQQMVLLNNHNDKDIKKYLEEHRQHVAAQIHRLKVLKEYLQTSRPALVNHGPALKLLESTPMIATGRIRRRGLGLDMLSPIAQASEQESCNNTVRHDGKSEIAATCINSANPTNEHSEKPFCNTTSSYSLGDISTWIGGHPENGGGSKEFSHFAKSAGNEQRFPIREVHNDLDEVLAKLQQILANNFTLDESLGNPDNGQLKSAVTEVEGMLTSLIDGVEMSRTNSTQHSTRSGRGKLDTVLC